MTNQGKLLTKHKVPWFWFIMSLPWPIEINGSKIFFHLNIVHQNVSCGVGLKVVQFDSKIIILFSILTLYFVRFVLAPFANLLQGRKTRMHPETCNRPQGHKRQPKIGRFHKHFTHSFYVRRSQKRTMTVKSSVSFGICPQKGCS